MISNYPDIYFLPEWGEVYQEHDGGQIARFIFQNNKGKVYYQFLKREIPGELDPGEYCDIVTPYGFSGPVILECDKGEEKRLVMDYDREFQMYCNEHKIVSEYIRFSPWIKNYEDFKEIYDLKYNNYTLFTDLTADDIFMDQFSSKIRNLIRKAIKNGVTIEFDNSGASVGRFIELYDRTAEKNDFSDYYRFRRKFLKKTFLKLMDLQFLVNAQYEGRTISSAIFLNYNNIIHYHLAANDPGYYSMNGNSLILHEVAKWGKSEGKETLHLGGAFSESLFAFKKQFTKSKPFDYFVGKKIRDQKKYNDLIIQNQNQEKQLNLDYFPLYRG